ncbi:MAG: hypothetical protein K6E86_00070 [Bacteroidales bacterium]|nr:hypothetical protein [Bacteroidales bacterium]
MKKISLLLAAFMAISVNALAQTDDGMPSDLPDGETPSGDLPGGDMPDGGGPGGESSSGADTTYQYGSDISGLWQSSSDYYYIVGLFYCSAPADSSYEQMGIYVPAAYLSQNSDGTYSINAEGTCNGYTAATAPIVVPVNTSGYSAQSAPTGESSAAATYTAEGFIYLWPGCRGRNHGAPLGVTDLKAAVRYYRSLAAQSLVPGNTDLIFSFGHSGGGAQSAIFGTSGNNSQYDAYLQAIGANMDYRDNICGSMCWCPITNLDQADGAYEWNMGLTRSSLSDADQSISQGLAENFVTYINAIGFKHPETGETLTLNSTSDGYYQSGSYYEYTMEVINDAVSRYNQYNSASVASYTTDDASALSDFASNYKKATKSLGAFDEYADLGSAENTLMGIAGTAGHFDPYLATLVQSYASTYYDAFSADLASDNVDAVGNAVQTRLMMYTPLYYLVDNATYYNGGGAGSSDVAPYWRIRSGIKQEDTALSTEINLALALQAYSGVKDVDFETIWGQGHTEAEDTGSASSNFISWVKECATSATTGIQQIGESQSESSAYYDLQGRAVSAPSQGMYVHNGKKIFVR